MRKMGFLNKLYREGNLELVEPNKNLKNSYLEKSESSLESSKILFRNDKLEEAISLVYYTMYHCLTALLFRVGTKSENHTGSIILLEKIFRVDNSKINDAKKEKIDKQYYTYFDILKERLGK